MKCYFALFFPSDAAGQPILKQWLIREGEAVAAGQDLLLYGTGALQKKLSLPEAATLKTYLADAGSALEAGQAVAVFQGEFEPLSRLSAQGLGKILEPEELKQSPYADPAEIRLPSDS